MATDNEGRLSVGSRSASGRSGKGPTRPGTAGLTAGSTPRFLAEQSAILRRHPEVFLASKEDLAKTVGNGVIVDGRWNFQAVRDWADETSKEELQEHIERILGPVAKMAVLCRHDIHEWVTAALTEPYAELRMRVKGDLSASAPLKPSPTEEEPD